MKQYFKNKLINLLKPLFKDVLEKSWNEGKFYGNTAHSSNKEHFNTWFNKL